MVLKRDWRNFHVSLWWEINGRRGLVPVAFLTLGYRKAVDCTAASGSAGNHPFITSVKISIEINTSGSRRRFIPEEKNAVVSRRNCALMVHEGLLSYWEVYQVNHDRRAAGRSDIALHTPAEESDGRGEEGWRNGATLKRWNPCKYRWKPPEALSFLFYGV